MSTNNERCEVVAKLRKHAKIARKVGYACVLKDCTREEECDGFGLGGCEGCFSKSLTRLADLIEPEPEQTCRNLSEDDDVFCCSECWNKTHGFMFDDFGCTVGFGKGVSKCPNCGAKVVDK